MLAVIRLRGSVNMNREVEDTMRMLRLRRVNHCVLVPDDKNFSGMLNKARNWITWGNISPGMLEELVSKRGRMEGNRKIDGKEAKSIAKKIIKDKSLRDAGIKPVFRLSPPRKGHRPIKLPYPRGGSGPRGEKINELLRRMI
jgi:large subunit ribosomal protein L30